MVIAVSVFACPGRVCCLQSNLSLDRKTLYAAVSIGIACLHQNNPKQIMANFGTNADLVDNFRKSSNYMRWENLLKDQFPSFDAMVSAVAGCAWGHRCVHQGDLDQKWICSPEVRCKPLVRILSVDYSKAFDHVIWDM